MRITVLLALIVWLINAQQAGDPVVARDLAAMQDKQARLERDIDIVKMLLQALLDARGGDAIDGLVGASVRLPAAPSRGVESAPVTIVELSDYHCPFCRRTARDVLPRLDREYIASGKVRYLFVDYPLTELHPASMKAHQAASCSRRHGKYWDMHDWLFANPPADDAGLTAAAVSLGIDAKEFRACLADDNYADETRQAISQIRNLHINATPMMLIGTTPAQGEALVVRRYVHGAQPFIAFKAAIEMTLLDVR